MRYLLLLATLAAAPAVAQLNGTISSPDGALEGVVVSARKDGAPVTVSVVTDASGRFAFPAGRLEPGRYALGIRATGYELEAPTSAELGDGNGTSVQLKLRKAADLGAQLTNAEWLASFPGTDEQKKFLYSCVGCHTLVKRMAGYTNNSHAERPQVRLVARDPMRDFGPNIERDAAFLATVNRGPAAAPYTLQTLPRVSGKGTRVVITEYQLPRKMMPHDVIIDADGIAWMSLFDEQFLGRYDPRTLQYTEFAIPVQRPDFPKGTLDLEIDPQGNLWLSHMFQSGAVKFDKRTQQFQAFPLPKERQNEHTQQSMVGPQRWTVDGKLWINDAGIPGPALRVRHLRRLEEQHLLHGLRRRKRGPHRRKHRQAHSLSHAHAALAPAPRPHGRRRPHLVRRVARGKNRHVRHPHRTIPRVAAAHGDQILRALRRGARQDGQGLDGRHEHRPRAAPRSRDRRLCRISAAQPDQHPPGVRRQSHYAAHVLGRQQPPRFAGKGRAAGLDRAPLDAWVRVVAHAALGPAVAAPARVLVDAARRAGILAEARGVVLGRHVRLRLIAPAPARALPATRASLDVERAVSAHQLCGFRRFLLVVGAHADDGAAAAHALGKGVRLLVRHTARYELREQPAAHVDVVAAEAGVVERADHAARLVRILEQTHDHHSHGARAPQETFPDAVGERLQIITYLVRNSVLAAAAR
ncbi:MAG: hypothetical protein E6H63_17640 [Betaproteobacteria bacterium]|nr:MAG: hypothetical protein E6H63_17640 [Betaproteobacteria bacterium]